MRKITFKINKDMETYIKPTLKVLSLNAEEIMEDDFIHYSIGDGNQLSKEIYLIDEVDQSPFLNDTKSIWGE